MKMTMTTILTMIIDDEKLIPNPNKETSIENPFINNDNYVDGLVEPEKRQIANFVQNTLKPKLIKTRGFNYADLAKWTMEHREIPDDWNEPMKTKTLKSNFLKILISQMIHGH